MNFDIMSLPESGTYTAEEGAVWLQITGPDCTTRGSYSAVAFGGGTFAGGITVTRKGDDWKVELVNQPLVVSEWTQLLATRPRGGSSCTTQLESKVLSHGISATFHWKRQLGY
jgi:hypothetical protein